VLIATTSMTTASGTVTYTRDLALSLLRHGWLPIVYATRLGAQAEVLRAATIPVVSELAGIGTAPDVIHGHHALETLAALARFPGVPALFVCHDARAWHSVPPPVPRIRTFVAVDRNCRDRMLFEHGVAEERLHVLTNGVDLRRFRPRPPLPARPRRALVFSNAASEGTFVAPIREACAARGIEVEVAGTGVGKAVEHPEEILAGYDLVFAKARCALEALAVGAAVIGCDEHGMSGMITSARLEALRQLNFGVRTLQLPITRENLLREIDLYDPVDAAAVSARIRASNDAELIAEQFIALYEELLNAPLDVGREDLSAALERVARHLYAQVGTGAKPYGGLRAALSASPLGGLVRLARRLGRR
jgi:Glycosyltransferase Family 4